MKYGIVEDGRTAILEMAAASGLPLLSKYERNPMKTSTYGTGQIIVDAFNKGCRNFMMGIGGSATNDGGTGMLRALGFTAIFSIQQEPVSLEEAMEPERISRNIKITVRQILNLWHSSISK